MPPNHPAARDDVACGNDRGSGGRPSRSGTNAQKSPEIPGAWLEEQAREQTSQALVAQWRKTIAGLLERQPAAGDVGGSA